MYTVKCREKLKAMGAPLTGWYCVDVIDSEEANFSCELCGHERIRYIHIMAHDDFDQKLSVGCICAGNLEGDIFAAKERERKLKSKNRRKKTFLKKE